MIVPTIKHNFRDYLAPNGDVRLSVCPAFTAYISVTMGWILIKLGENVGTSVQLIVLKFEHSAAKGNTTHKGKTVYRKTIMLRQTVTLATAILFIRS